MTKISNWDITVPYQWTPGPVLGTFLGGLREKTITGVKCNSCGKVYVPPQDLCRDCLEDMQVENFVEVKPEGTVEGFVKIRQNFFGERPSKEYLSERISPADIDQHPLLWFPEVPYVVAMIKLDEADTCMLHLVKGADMDNLKMGSRVRAAWKEETIGHIMDIDSFKITE